MVAKMTILSHVLLYLIITCIAITHFPPSIYDTLSEKNLRDHYEFPDRKDGMLYTFTYIYIIIVLGETS